MIQTLARWRSKVCRRDVKNLVAKILAAYSQSLAASRQRRSDDKFAEDMAVACVLSTRRLVVQCTCVHGCFRTGVSYRHMLTRQ